MSAPWTACDLFGGAGGWGTGAQWAGVEVLDSVNHWPVATDTYRLNHPQTRVHREDISVMNPSVVAPHRLGIASPSCTGFSRARGEDSPTHDIVRMTAHGVLHVWEIHQPERILVENVEEFLLWSSQRVMAEKGWQRRLEGRVTVYTDGAPSERRAGGLFLAWKASLEAMGYGLTVNVLDAARFGVPQERVRVIISGCLGGRPAPIRYPAAREVPAADIIDWSAGAWTSVSEMVAATQRRWRNGRAEFGERFVMSYYGNTTNGRSLSRPLGTVPAADVWAVVDGGRMRMLSIPELKRAMSFPDDYRLPCKREDATKLLGNAVPPLMARHVVAQTIAAA